MLSLTIYNHFPLRNRIDPSLAKWMAPHQPSDTQENPFEQSPFLDRLVHVNRTGRLKSASKGETRRNESLVAFQQNQDQRLEHIAGFDDSAGAYYASAGTLIGKAFSRKQGIQRAIQRS
jgi:hypothetical protein